MNHGTFLKGPMRRHRQHRRRFVDDMRSNVDDALEDAVDVNVDGTRVSINIKLPPEIGKAVKEALEGVGQSLGEAVKHTLSDWLRGAIVDAQPLSSLEPGQRFRVVFIRHGYRMRRRLREVGLLVGAEAELVERSPLIVKVGDARIGLSYVMGRHVMVRPLPAAPDCDEARGAESA
jgi:Fe2+ transport system protein FeoA